MEAVSRCLEPEIGVKVLSYDLLEGEEKAEVDAHLKKCQACRDLIEQAFGDAGAFHELEYRAFRAAQRRDVEAHAWILRRLRDLWPAVLGIVVLTSALLLFLVRRAPDPERVGIVKLATIQEAALDSLSGMTMPRIESAPFSVLVRPDRDAVVLIYETGDGYMRRLVPPADAVPPELSAERAHELALPPLQAPTARLLLLLIPAGSPASVAEWDLAVQARLGAETEDEDAKGDWPQGISPTVRWLR